jgi:hypothetical protein
LVNGGLMGSRKEGRINMSPSTKARAYLPGPLASAAVVRVEDAVGEAIREGGDRRGQGALLGGPGIAHDSLGQVERAIEYHEEAVAIAREISDRRSEGVYLGSLFERWESMQRLVIGCQLPQID